ncbi:MAG: phage holin family protein, partial [Comamonadaceae bacterium]
RIRRVRVALGEGAQAAEDRVQLVRMAWDDEKQRLKRIAALGIAVMGLTTVTVALVSVAVVVHFWDTPQRITAAWSVAAVWVVLWLAAVALLLSTLRNAHHGFVPAQREFGRDWDWLQDRFAGDENPAPREPRPATRDELLARIADQRARIARLEAGAQMRSDADAAVDEAPPPPDESAPDAMLRIARKHPVAAGVAAAVAVVVLKPRRVLRWSAFLAPILWRMR